MDQSPQFTRLIQALKGTGRLSDPKARLVITQATTRDLRLDSGFGGYGTVIGSSGAQVCSITDPNGNRYAMLDLTGFADGATLY